MPKTFQIVCALWVTPDFSEVMSGKRKPPHINHSKVDFDALATMFKELFPYGPPVTISVPNDTVDQVTVTNRSTQGDGQAMRCEDFGTALLTCAKKQSGSVIDVRLAWQKLHVLPDRDFAPPPLLLPFVVTASDFEDAMIWTASAKPALGLSFLPPGLQELAGEAVSGHNGKLPLAARKQLESIFGTPFEEMAVLDRLAMDKLPAYARRCSE